MTDKKLCGLRSVPSLFRVSPIWSACCRPVRRGHYKETALLFGRVAGRFTWSVNARSLRSLVLGSVGFASLASLRSPLAPLVLGSGFACLGYAPTARLGACDLRSQLSSLRSFVLRFTPKKSGIFEKKERSPRTHIFPENGIFSFCSASATQKHNSQKSTLHNTQLCDIFYPSAFGYGKCHITCVMYKPLRLWLRGSTFLLRRSDQSTAFAGVRLFSAWSLRPPAFGRATSAPTLRPPAFAGVRSPLFPSPPDRLCRRSTSDGVGFGANDRPSASRLWRGVSVGFAIADFARYDFAYVAASVLRGFLCLRYRSDNNRYSVLRTP